MPTFPTPIQHSPEISSQSNKARSKNKRNKNPKSTRNHKQLQQCGSIPNQFGKISSLSIHNNEQIEKEYRKAIPVTIDLKKSNT
jgi:hypothetical protein